MWVNIKDSWLSKTKITQYYGVYYVYIEVKYLKTT